MFGHCFQIAFDCKNRHTHTRAESDVDNSLAFDNKDCQAYT